MTQAASSKPPRPLSPHLQIYRWSVTMALSILHRVTGVALVAGTMLLAVWLWAAAYNGTWFNAIHVFFGGVIGKCLLIGWTAAFYLHLCNGIRHLFWDTGRGFELPVARRSGWAVILIAFVLTLVTWAAILGGGVK